MYDDNVTVYRRLVSGDYVETEMLLATGCTRVVTDGGETRVEECGGVSPRLVHSGPGAVVRGDAGGWRLARPHRMRGSTRIHVPLDPAVLAELVETGATHAFVLCRGSGCIGTGVKGCIVAARVGGETICLAEGGLKNGGRWDSLVEVGALP